MRHEDLKAEVNRPAALPQPVAAFDPIGVPEDFLSAEKRAKTPREEREASHP